MDIIFLIIMGIVIIIIGPVFYLKVTNKNYLSPEENLRIASNHFEDGETLPIQYTSFGKNISPNINLEKITLKGKSIAIIMDDLDTPFGLLNHWVIWNIPIKYRKIPSGIEKGKIVHNLDGAVQGRSEYGGKHYYKGPKPLWGTHRYIFRVYVLDKMLSIDENSKKVDLQKAMEGHIVQFGTIKTKYSRK